MQRLAAFIDAGSAGLSDIAVTLDSHHRLDIAHASFWQTGEGAPVAPFTTIDAEQVRSGAFAPREPAARPRALEYLDALEARGRYRLMAWPVHCEIGSWGHNVHRDVRAAYNAWEDRKLGTVQKIVKGTNPWTEHYSALLAEVPDDEDPATELNREWVERLDGAELLLIAGEASSHCVRATTEDLVDHLPGGRLGRIVLLTDCMSPVAGFEAQHASFLAAMAGKGVRLASSTEVIGEVLATASR
jgi:nicotinamidase-related amidase